MGEKTNWEEICPKQVPPLTVEQKFPGGLPKMTKEIEFRTSRAIALKMVENAQSVRIWSQILRENERLPLREKIGQSR